MKGRKQKISKDTCPRNNRAEPEDYVERQTFMWITENNITNAVPTENGLLEHILSPANLNRAYERISSNKGSAGSDKMEVEPLKDYLVAHKDTLISSMLGGKFRPNPVRWVEISKDNGKERMLGIPR
tara:strand:+ start:311 stop:691 length:381 start_codon:yes stop_codon:yes gene_type:complete